MKPYPPLDLSHVVTRFAYAPEKGFGRLISQMGPMADGAESIFMYYLDAETETEFVTKGRGKNDSIIGNPD